ncbi:hypothetical protein RRG08_033098 [Elysia crispata]|uniref:Uncharacterized protein n=1 Tax=Elysia crispata TaxID=231223 RepID=A0AAE1BAK4_9GAST|nr:hypothetical protein RRG08_033098 [Elysia crispata]
MTEMAARKGISTLVPSRAPDQLSELSPRRPRSISTADHYSTNRIMRLTLTECRALWSRPRAELTGRISTWEGVVERRAQSEKKRNTSDNEVARVENEP